MTTTPKKRGIGADIGKRAREAAEQQSAPASADTRSELVQRSSMLKATDDTVYSTSRWVDPDLCKPSPVNARDYDALTYEDCKDLIDTILSEGQQRVAATVRATDDPEKPYEIVAGLRRHFSISWLRANNYPDFKYLITVAKMDDEAAFRFSDLENRARTDITDVERARSYTEALAKFYGGDLAKMANRIGLSDRNLRRYITLGELDEVFISALGGYRFAKVKHATDIASAGKAEIKMDAMKAEAEVIAAEQGERAGEGADLFKPADVVKRLIAASKSGAKPAAKASPKAKLVEVNSSSGKPMLTYAPGTSRAATTIKVAPDTDAGPDEIKEALSKIIDDQFAQKS